MHERQGDVAPTVTAERPSPKRASRAPARRVPTIQAKLEVGAADDHFEREADEIARSVVARIHSDDDAGDLAAEHVHTGTCCDEHSIGRIMRKEEAAGAPAGGRGAGLPDSVKAGVESLSGVGLSDVRVHYNSPAPAGLNALAYTQGADIHVVASAPGPDTPAGQEVLRHEAWHVVQQRGGRVPAGEVQRVMRKATDVGAAGGEVASDTEQMIRSSSGGGRPLDAGVRGQMESAFGTDFGAVRTHTGPRATEMNERIQAKAFTHGSNIYFRGAMPDTSSSAGQELLAHELTHTIQQGGGVAARRITRAQRRVR